MAKSKTDFTGDINELKEAAVILYNIRKREKEVEVTPYLSKSYDNLKNYKKKADEWIAKNIKNKNDH